MPPAAKNAATVKKEPCNKEKEVPDLRKQQDNMLAQLAKSNDSCKQGVLATYRALPRFSDQKKEILALWAKDKTCNWHTSWQKQMVSAERDSEPAPWFWNQVFFG